MQVRVAVKKIMMQHQQKSDLVCYSYGYWKCMFVDTLSEYISPPNVFTTECGVVNKIERRSPISFRHGSS